MNLGRPFKRTARGLVVAILLYVPALGQNSLSIPDQKVIPGQHDVWFPVLISCEENVEGFTLRGTYDPGILTLKRHSLNFTIIGTPAPEFLQVNIHDHDFEVGCVIDFFPPYLGRRINPVHERRLLNLLFDVSQDAAPGSQTRVDLENRPDVSSIQNTFTINAMTVFPLLRSSVVEVMPPASSSSFFLRGDVNSNGFYEISDAVVILNYLFLSGPRPRCLDAADIDDSGLVTVTSAVALLNFMFLGGQPPAVPFPNAGLDPTPDLLPPCR